MFLAFRKFPNYFTSTKKCILVTTTKRHELLHLSSSEEEAVTKVILHGHEILKESSSKVAIHPPSGDTDILRLTLTHLYEYKERMYIIDTQSAFTCSKLTIETIEQGVKYVQS